MRRFRPGDLVVYRKTKISSSPGRRAVAIDPAPRGEQYWYQVDKFWVVSQCDDPDQVIVQTRRGKQHRLETTDVTLRRATWIERIFYRHRFPALES